ncbi:DUF188 domain-containing protein [Bacillus sp. sid0103]|uniref:DUF188 domain-containing protein n=1 Tax=Bacillus sp. sid0103 TaxID=2856337 RepID=UPI0035B1D1F0
MQTDWKYVDAGKEAANLFIMNYAVKGDITITQDIGLASTLLLKMFKFYHQIGYSLRKKEYKLPLSHVFLMQRLGKGQNPFNP